MSAGGLFAWGLVFFVAHQVRAVLLSPAGQRLLDAVAARLSGRPPAEGGES